MLVLLAAGSLDGGELTGRRYVEEFTTREHCDTVQTTARWDTTAGLVTMHPFEIIPVDGFNTTGSAYAVAVAGDCAFVADYTAGVLSIDISDPSDLQLAVIGHVGANLFEPVAEAQEPHAAAVVACRAEGRRAARGHPLGRHKRPSGRCAKVEREDGA